MITKKIIAPLLVVILIAGISGVLAAKKTTEQRAQNNLNAATEEQSADSMSSGDETKKSATTQGRYTTYDPAKVSDSSYDTTILFFYASWCPECRSFKNAINSSGVPEGNQVLEINYDTASELKKQHGVTLQSTFVKVDTSGKQLSKWVGYGKDKSLQTILNNL